MDSTLRASLRLSKITFGDFVAALNPGYILHVCYLFPGFLYPDVMGNIIKFKKPSLTQKHQGKTLCKSGFHQWRVVNTQPFDVKNGGLVTRYECPRCGAVKTTTR